MRASPARRRTSPARWLGIVVRNVGQAVARDDAEGIVKHTRQMAVLLRQHGSDFDDLADALERLGPEIEHVELKPDTAVSYENIKILQTKHAQRIPLGDVLWVGDLLARLKRGEEPTIDDRRALLNLKARLRLAMP